MVYDTCTSIVEEHKKSNNFQDFEMDLIRYSSMTSPFTKEAFESRNAQDLIDELYQQVYKNYQEKIEKSAALVYPVIAQVYESPENKFERIQVPFTDGTKTLSVVTNLKNAYESEGKELIRDFEKNISLAIIDDTWKDHLRMMDELKQSVQNARFEQKDPLLIYKFEAFELFKKTLDKINKEVLSFLLKGKLPNQDDTKVSQAREEKRENVQLSKEAYGEQDRQGQQTQTNAPERPQVVETIVRSERKIGRNEKVQIKNVLSGQSKEVKYKQAIPLIQKGEWVIVGQD
jgi:preprotein translocase subunit SecA